MKKKIEAKTEAELQKLLAEKREALHKFRFGLSGGKSKDVKSARNLRREVAQILTKLNASKK